MGALPGCVSLYILTVTAIIFIFAVTAIIFILPVTATTSSTIGIIGSTRCDQAAPVLRHLALLQVVASCAMSCWSAAEQWEGSQGDEQWRGGDEQWHGGDDGAAQAAACVRESRALREEVRTLTARVQTLELQVAAQWAHIEQWDQHQTSSNEWHDQQQASSTGGVSSHNNAESTLEIQNFGVHQRFECERHGYHSADGHTSILSPQLLMHGDYTDSCWSWTSSLEFRGASRITSALLRAVVQRLQLALP